MQQGPSAQATPSTEDMGIQRVPDGHTQSAQAIIPEAVDVEQIADLVYRMIRQDLLLEQERSVRSGWQM